MRILLATALLAACAPKGRVVQETPRWMTEKDQVKVEIVRTLVESQDYIRALELIDQMRAEGIVREELDLMQGIALREQGMHESSERLLIRAEQGLPKSAEVQTALCILYADQARHDEAIEHCKSATKLDETDHSAWNNLGYLLLTTRGKAEEAKIALQHAVDIESNNPRYRNNLALAQASAGDHRGALRTFMTTGTPADAHYNVGTAFERNGDEETALTYYKRALKYDEDHSPADLALKRLSEPGEEN